MFLVQATDLRKQHSILLPNLVFVVVDVLEELWIVFQLMFYIADNYDAKVLSFSLASEGVTDELESDVLEDGVKKSILNDSAEKLGDFFQILRWVLVQEAVLVEKSMQHAGIDLLLLDNLRFLEPLHLFYEMLDSSVHFGRRTLEDVLEVLVGGAINLLVRVLGGLVRLWEKDGVSEN
jgi:hypothetical protein